jgi:hypothetical protein
MALQTLTVQPLPKESALLNPTYATLTGSTGISFPNTGREVLAVINGSTASTATVNFAGAPLGQAITPFSVAMPTSNTTPQFLGPFHPTQFNDVNGNVNINLSSVTGLTVAVLQIPGVY